MFLLRTLGYANVIRDHVKKAVKKYAVKQFKNIYPCPHHYKG